MSLDVYLEGDEVTEKCECPNCGDVHEHTYRPEVFWVNITHNLSAMADAAGIGDAMWEPEKLDAKSAWQLIEPLRNGLALLKSDPERFKAYNPENGWGTYEGLVKTAEEYLVACEANPNAIVHVSR